MLSWQLYRQDESSLSFPNWVLIVQQAVKLFILMSPLERYKTIKANRFNILTGKAEFHAHSNRFRVCSNT